MATAFAAAEPGGLRTGILIREVRAATVVAAAIGAASALGGVVWAYLAPAEQLAVVGKNQGVALTGESVHRFDALAIFVLIGFVTAVLTASAAWRWRSARGPLGLLGTLLGSVGGAVLMKIVGEAVAEQVHTRPANPALHTIVQFAPSVESWAVIIVQPLTAALVMLILAALSTRDDLGTGALLPFGGNPPEPDVQAPNQFGSAITYGPYYGAGGAPQPAAPRDPMVPFEAPGSAPEPGTAR